MEAQPPRLFIPISKFLLGLALGFFGILPAPCLAASYSDAWGQRFVDASGRFVSPSMLASDQGKDSMMVLFWASWCAPCMEELSQIAAAAEMDATTGNEQFSRIAIVAVNVDDEAGWGTGQIFLHRIRWPFPSLRDDAGIFFFSAHPSGTLPLSLLFKRSGQLMATYDQMTPEILATADATGSTIDNGYTFTQSAAAVSQKVSGIEKPAAVIVNSSSLTYRRDAWSAAIAHDIMRQKPLGREGWNRPEDELGFSYVQWQRTRENHREDSQAPSHTNNPIERVRAGDDAVAFLGGALLAARRRPDTNEAASLAGLHADIAANEYLSATLVAGQIRDRLFPFELNASQDLSIRQPRETVMGTQMRIRRHGGLHAAFGLLQYRAEEDLWAGVPQRYQDYRVGANLGFGGASAGVDLQYVAYVPQPESGQAAGNQVQIGSRFSALDSFALSTSVQHCRELPPRVAVPELTDFPFLPLAIANRDTVRLIPSINIEGVGLVSLSHVHDEEATRTPGHGPDRQGTTVLKWRGQQRGLEIQAGQQRGRSATLGQKYQENAVNAAIDLVHGVHLSAMIQSYSARDSAEGTKISDGRRTRTRLDADINSLFNSTSVNRLHAGVAAVNQSRHYVESSGIDGTWLSSGDFSLVRKSLRLRLAGGREPGGLVCNGGSCAQRAPLAGGRVDLEWQYIF